MKRLLDYDEWSGVATWWEPSSDGREFTLARTQDVGALLDANRRAANDAPSLHAKGTVALHLHARIPVVWREAFIKRYGHDIVHPAVQREFWRELERPENRYLKTTWRRHSVRG